MVAPGGGLDPGLRALLDQVADRYRSEGYEVVVSPGPSQVPDFVREDGVDLIAYKGEESVII